MRDLKNEYESMLDAQIPDLWSRIEPKLTEKKAPVAGGVAQGNAAAFAGKGAAKRRISKRTLTMWASLAAACVCLAVAIPVFMRNGGRSSNDEAEYMKPHDKNMAADGEWYENAYEATDNMSVANGGAPGMAANAPSESKAETSMGFTQNVPADSKADVDAAETATELAEADRADEMPAPDLVNRDVLYTCRAEVVENRQAQDGIYYTLKLTEAVYDLELKADTKTLEALCTGENVREKTDAGRALPEAGYVYTFTLQAAYQGNVPCYLLIDWE